jgi:4-amino-4-deoxy-L-arabinose transferase-like glycosyltransferase
MSWTRKDWLLLAAITALAALFRFYQLGVIPTGFQFDEAFNAIDAQQVLAGNRPFFLPANAGREVLYTYWQAALIRLFGFDVYTLRLASAILGLLAIPITYLLVRRLLTVHSRSVAAATALVLAISIWHVHFSRYGIRVISMPIIFSGLFGFAWLGAHGATRRTRLLAYVASGVLTGLSVWTHPTGRLAPFVLIGFTLWLLWRNPDFRTLRWDRPLGGLLISGVVAFLVFLPLGLEFYRHPEFFLGHASEVSVFAERVGGGSPLATLWDNFIHVLGMFSFAGDREWTHGLAGRPVFDWPLALLFYIGIIIWAARLLPRRRDPDADALALFAIWATVMLFPSILSDAAPNYSRTLPALPAILIPAGLGITWLIGTTRPLAGRLVWLGPVAAIFILVYSTVRMSYDYFIRFAESREVYYMYDGDKLDALNYLHGYVGENQVYLSQLWGDMHSTVYLLRQNLGIKSLDTADTLVLPPPGQGAVYAFPAEQRERAEQLATLWPNVAAQPMIDPYGNVLLYTVQLDPATAAAWPPERAPQIERNAAFADAPTLLGMDAATPDKQVTLYWHAEAPTVTSLTTFIHLLDQDGRRVAQADKLPGNGSYPTTVWTEGERVIDRAFPTLLDPCVGGETLQVKVGWYELREGTPQRPRTDSPGTNALAGKLTLVYYSYPPDALTPGVLRAATISPTLTLLGFTRHEDAIQPGSPLTLDLFWLHDPASNTLDPGSQPISLALVGGETPTVLWEGAVAPGANWRAGNALCRRIRTSLPSETPPGDYTLLLRWNGADPSASVELTPLNVAPSTRRYDLPELARPVAVTLADDEGAEIRLAGLAAPPALAPDRSYVDLQLVWQPVGPITGNYKAFVHLLDNRGTIVAQSDTVPAEGYTTNRWLPAEVIVDRHIVYLPAELPAGDYTLVAGLYEPIDVHRLTARNAAGDLLADGLVPLGPLTLPPLE